MEVRNGDGVPGAAGQRACKETALIINEMVDYDFDNLLRKLGCRG